MPKTNIPQDYDQALQAAFEQILTKGGMSFALARRKGEQHLYLRNQENPLTFDGRVKLLILDGKIPDTDRRWTAVFHPESQQHYYVDGVSVNETFAPDGKLSYAEQMDAVVTAMAQDDATGAVYALARQGEMVMLLNLTKYPHLLADFENRIEILLFDGGNEHGGSGKWLFHLKQQQCFHLDENPLPRQQVRPVSP